MTTITARPTPLFFFLRNILCDINTQCWVWVGKTERRGYGRHSVRGVHWKAHRWSYATFCGPLTPGLTLDHVCLNPPCVNPEHLDEVSLAENVRRGNALRTYRRPTHCKRGHEFTADNTYRGAGGRQVCRKCRVLTQRRYVARRTAA